jgi:ubiquinone/menaquinone biosynthesis C-methylase UbiE
MVNDVVDFLRCPVTRQPVTLTPDGQSLRTPDGRSYRVLSQGEVSFFDLRPDQLDAQAELQKGVYDAEESRYALQTEQDREWMRGFVAGFESGTLKNKDVLLRDALVRVANRKPRRVLELGCNDGRFLQTLLRLSGAEGVGVDLAAKPVRRAIEMNQAGARAGFHVADASRLPFSDESFDAVIAFDVFEHLGHAALARCLRECRRVLRPGGSLLVYIVSRRDKYTLHETLRAITHGRVGVDNGEGHQYENFVEPDEYRSMCTDAGLAVEELQAYHGFWTLFAEEFMQNRIPEWGFKVLRYLDWPLTRAEHGNGFLALARRSA